jgi:hypothetical protein
MKEGPSGSAIMGGEAREPAHSVSFSRMSKIASSHEVMNHILGSAELDGTALTCGCSNLPHQLPVMRMRAEIDGRLPTIHSRALNGAHSFFGLPAGVVVSIDC